MTEVLTFLQVVSDLTRNDVFLPWLGEHLAFILFMIGFCKVVASMTTSTKDDEFWEKLGELVKSPFKKENPSPEKPKES